MTSKTSTHISVTIRMHTYDSIQTIRKKTPTDNGFPPSMPVIMNDIVDFYVQGHPEIGIAS